MLSNKNFNYPSHVGNQIPVQKKCTMSLKPPPKPIITQPITKLNIQPPQKNKNKNKNKNKKKLLKRISDKQKLLAAVVGFIALTSIFVNAGK